VWFECAARYLSGGCISIQTVVANANYRQTDGNSPKPNKLQQPTLTLLFVITLFNSRSDHKLATVAGVGVYTH